MLRVIFVVIAMCSFAYTNQVVPKIFADGVPVGAAEKEWVVEKGDHGAIAINMYGFKKSGKVRAKVRVGYTITNPDVEPEENFYFGFELLSKGKHIVKNMYDIIVTQYDGTEISLPLAKEGKLRSRYSKRYNKTQTTWSFYSSDIESETVQSSLELLRKARYLEFHYNKRTFTFEMVHFAESITEAKNIFSSITRKKQKKSSNSQTLPEKIIQKNKSASGNALVFRVNTKKESVVLRVKPTISSKNLGDLENEQEIVAENCISTRSGDQWCYAHTYNSMINGSFEGWVQKKYLEPYSNKTYVNIEGKMPVKIFSEPSGEASNSAYLVQKRNCYYSLGCKINQDKEWCAIVYDFSIGNNEERYTKENFKTAWIQQEKLTAVTKYGAMPLSEEEDGFCTVKDALDTFAQEEQEKKSGKRQDATVSDDTLNDEELYVCYTSKNIDENGQKQYHGCLKSTVSCDTKGMIHFGKYPNTDETEKALQRCLQSSPREIKNSRINDSMKLPEESPMQKRLSEKDSYSHTVKESKNIFTQDEQEKKSERHQDTIVAGNEEKENGNKSIRCYGFIASPFFTKKCKICQWRYSSSISDVHKGNTQVFKDNGEVIMEQENYILYDVKFEVVDIKYLQSEQTPSHAWYNPNDKDHALTIYKVPIIKMDILYNNSKNINLTCQKFGSVFSHEWDKFRIREGNKKISINNNLSKNSKQELIESIPDIILKNLTDDDKGYSLKWRQDDL